MRWRKNESRAVRLLGCHKFAMPLSPQLKGSLLQIFPPLFEYAGKLKEDSAMLCGQGMDFVKRHIRKFCFLGSGQSVEWHCACVRLRPRFEPSWTKP